MLSEGRRVVARSCPFSSTAQTPKAPAVVAYSKARTSRLGHRTLIAVYCGSELKSLAPPDLGVSFSVGNRISPGSWRGLAVGGGIHWKALSSIGVLD